MGLSFGSVCSGIEAASVAWHPLGWHAAWLAEIDKAASAVLAHRFPTVANHGDMLELAGKVRRREIEAPDILVGGTPCQAFSVAGRRKGLDDARGQLTIAFIDLADAIDEVRRADGKPPVVIIWENVPGVLTVKGNAFGCFLAGLAGEGDELQPAGRKWTHAGCVFGPERAIAWRTLDAQYFGLAQRRRRVFLVASAREGFYPAGVLFEREGVRRDSAPSREQGQVIAGTLDARTEGGGFPGTDGACANHVVPERRLRQLDGSLAFGGGNQSGPIDVATALNANERYDFDSETFLLEAIPINANALRSGEAKTPSADADGLVRLRNPSLGIGKEGDPADTITAAGPGYVAAVAFSSKDYGQDATEDLSPTLRSGTHSDSHANGGAPPAIAYSIRTAHTGANGIGVDEHLSPTLDLAVPPAVAAYMPARTFAKDGEVDTRYAERDICDALHTSSGHGNKAPLIAEMAVRRLMPIECERLQGFPDRWTLVPTGPKQKPAADGPRYKQLGNSMAVNCMRWIGLRLAFYLASLEPANDDFDSLMGDDFDALLLA